MAETIELNAKDLCKLCSTLADGLHQRVGAEHVKGEKVHTLADLRPDVTTKGNVSVKRIGCSEDGTEKWYGGNYEFMVTALVVDGVRVPISQSWAKRAKRA